MYCQKIRRALLRLPCLSANFRLLKIQLSSHASQQSPQLGAGRRTTAKKFCWLAPLILLPAIHSQTRAETPFSPSGRTMYLLFALLVTLGVVSAAGNAASALWPLPWQMTTGEGTTSLDAEFHFQLKSMADNSVVKQAADRYLKLINAPKNTAGNIKSCSISVSGTTPKEVIGADESYTLHVDESSCEISANTNWGALRGLETFSQLLARTSGPVTLDSVPVDITDKPRYGHRGMLIDTARHYLPVSEIKRIIDSMPTNKFNVLHWHAVDAESFPLNTPSEPSLIKGAFSPEMVYSMADVTDISQYASARGVELVMELDIPGHAASWTAGKKEIMTDCFAKYYYNINDFALNPAVDETYITVQNVLLDLTKAAKSSKIHLGGDEVVYGCWKNDTSVTAYMNANGIPDYDALLTSFVKRVDSNVLGANHQVNSIIHWEEVFVAKSNLDKATTIYQVWTDSSMISQLTGASYRVIASPSNYWYLNIPANTWQVMYGYDPVVGLTSTQASFIIGGEAALWGEYVDELNIESSIYPRANAVAERLWSDPAQTASSTDALPRLFNQRCRMVNRGVATAPVQPGGYCSQIYI